MTDAPHPRYQPLQVDASQAAPSTENAPLPRARSGPRNPFYCAGCGTSLLSFLSEHLSPVLPTRAKVTGYTSGVLVNLFNLVCAGLVGFY